jgi:hypothetical protein
LIDDELKDCTFKPKLVAKTESPVKPRYMRNKAPAQLPIDDNDEHAFQPKVNDNRNMYFSTGSQQYLQTNAFERLSRPKSPTTSSSKIDEELYKENDYQIPPGRSKSAGRTVNLKAFLDRQNQTVKRKQDKIQLIQNSNNQYNQSKSFINKKSAAMLNANSKSADFLKRQEHHLIRKQQHKKQIVQAMDKDCTFKPHINNMSKQLPRRTFEDMSNGDKDEYYRKVAELKRGLEERELASATFNPKINKNMEIQGTLRIMDDPDGYMSRIKSQQQLNEMKQKKHAIAKEQAELQQCTFQPETHDAPDYVKRIARSMALTRMHSSTLSVSSGKQQKTKQKPDWK